MWLTFVTGIIYFHWRECFLGMALPSRVRIHGLKVKVLSLPVWFDLSCTVISSSMSSKFQRYMKAPEQASDSWVTEPLNGQRVDVIISVKTLKLNTEFVCVHVCV